MIIVIISDEDMLFKYTGWNLHFKSLVKFSGHRSDGREDFDP